MNERKITLEFEANIKNNDIDEFLSYIKLVVEMQFVEWGIKNPRNIVSKTEMVE